jgi:hypothetical protein
MKNYPIIFGPHGGLVAGNGFIARVTIRGRCLFEETDQDFYSVLGVDPGAVAGDGNTMGEAHHAFLERVRLIVFEIAEEAEDFESFQAQVRQFVETTNRPNEHLWDRAVELVRAGEVDLEGVRREDADSTSWVKVDLIAAEDEAGPRPRIEPAMNEPSTHEDFQIAAGF